MYFLQFFGDSLTPFSAFRSSKLPELPKEPLKDYLDRVYGQSPAGVKRLANNIIGDKRFANAREEYEAIRYCINAIRNSAGCRNLSDNDRWSLYYDLLCRIVIITQHMENSALKRDLQECHRDLERWMDAIHHITVSASDVLARMRRTAAGSSVPNGRDMHGDLDAVQKAMRISKVYGEDWRGYDAEAPGPDPEARGRDPESFRGDSY